LHLIVVGFTVHLVDMSGFLPLHYYGRIDDLVGCRDIKETFTQFWQGQDQRLGDERLELTGYLLCLFHLVERVRLFSSLYRGSPCSPSWDTNQLRAVRHPMSH
jgi:hypothetical protein